MKKYRGFSFYKQRKSMMDGIQAPYLILALGRAGWDVDDVKHIIDDYLREKRVKP